MSPYQCTHVTDVYNVTSKVIIEEYIISIRTYAPPAPLGHDKRESIVLGTFLSSICQAHVEQERWLYAASSENLGEPGDMYTDMGAFLSPLPFAAASRASASSAR